MICGPQAFFCLFFFHSSYITGWGLGTTHPSLGRGPVQRRPQGHLKRWPPPQALPTLAKRALIPLQEGLSYPHKKGSATLARRAVLPLQEGLSYPHKKGCAAHMPSSSGLVTRAPPHLSSPRPSSFMISKSPLLWAFRPKKQKKKRQKTSKHGE